MHAASDLVVAHAGVARVAAPDASLDPAVRAVAAVRSPLIVASAALAPTAKRSAACAVGAVDLERAEIVRPLRNGRR